MTDHTHQQVNAEPTVGNAFCDDLAEFIARDLAMFNPTPDYAPIPNCPISVDWLLTLHNRRFYVFGVRDSETAQNAAIALQEFRKEQQSFISLVVHEDIERLGRQESVYLTTNADSEYPTLSDFRDLAVRDIRRLTGNAY